MLTILRRIGFPLRLVRSRLGAGGERLALVAFGVVAGAAVLAAVLAGRLVMQDRALAQATTQLAPADRVVQVTWSGAVNSFAGLDTFVAPRLRALTGERPAAAMLFRESSIQGRLVNLRAANDLGRYVRLISGRLPAVCRPSHCEVLRLSGRGPIPSTSALRLVEVGRATLKPDAPFGPFVLPAPPTELVARAVRYHTPQPSPIVIANGVAGLSATTELETFYRAYAWTVPLRRGDVHPWSVGDFGRRVQQLAAQVESNGTFTVSAPTDQLATAAGSSNAAARRLLLLGGEGGALLLAFTILAAAALRDDVTAARRRLVWFGARRWQLELHTLAEAAALAAFGTAVGWAVGAGVATLIARRAGSPASQVLDHALFSGGGILAALGVAFGAALLLYLTVRAPSVHLGRLAFTPLDAAALGAVAVVLVGWARGSVDAGRLTDGATSTGGTSAFLILVPALVVFAAAVLAARLLAPCLKGIGRLGRRGPVALRLAAASLGRSPGHASIAATFLVASLGLALFAATYRSTLLTGQRDEARFAVPAAFVASEDLSQLVPVLHGAPLSRFPGQSTQVLRLSGNVPSGTTFAFLALPAHRLSSVGGWRADFSARSLSSLGAAIAPRASTELRTVALPPGRRFSLSASTSGDDVGLRAFFRSPLGDYVAVALGHTDGRRTVELHGRIPFVHATFAELQFDVLNSGRLTANAGTGIQPSAKGVLTLSAPRVDGRTVPRAFASWLGTGGVSGAPARLGYILTPDRTGTFRPRQPTDGLTLPVLATPRVVAEAGPHGIIPLDIEGEQVAGRVVGVIDRFPSVVGDAVVADRQTAATVLDTLSPGLGTTNELWLNVAASREASAATTLARAPFTQLAIASRHEVLARLQADPLARGALLTLAGTAAIALLLALVGLLLSVVGDVRDDRGELFDLEAQGASPATIRAHLRLRALLIAVFGVAGGVALGAVLSALVISLVSVTASAATSEPPLRLTVDLPLLAAATAGYALAAAALVGTATLLRGRAPTRAAEAFG